MSHVFVLTLSWKLSLFQIGGTDAVYRVVIDPPGEVVADVGAETCTGEMCRLIYSSNTLTNSSTVSVDVVGCVTERMDATDISTRKITPVYALSHEQLWLLQLTVHFYSL